MSAGTLCGGCQTSRARFSVLAITFPTFSHQPALCSGQHHLNATVFQERGGGVDRDTPETLGSRGGPSGLSPSGRWLYGQGPLHQNLTMSREVTGQPLWLGLHYKRGP